MKNRRVILPDKGNRQRIWRWLLANGCRDIVALEPVIIHYTQRGKIIEYRPDDYRCPSCLVLGVNLAGRWLHVVCGIHEDALWILTAYWPDLDHWNASYTERKKKGE